MTQSGLRRHDNNVFPAAAISAPWAMMSNQTPFERTTLKALAEE